jgi:hypothetical protein
LNTSALTHSYALKTREAILRLVTCMVSYPEDVQVELQAVQPWQDTSSHALRFSRSGPPFRCRCCHG